MNFLGRACVWLFGFFKVALLVSTLGLAFVVLLNAAALEANYFRKYENAHSQIVIEHQRNLVVGEILQSQMAWERTADGLRQAYLDERANRCQIEKQLKIREYEWFAFLKVLEKKYPGATMEVLSELAPGLPLQPPQTCPDSACPENDIEISILVEPSEKKDE